MIGLYVGSTAGYSGKNLITMALALKFKKEGLEVGYMKPVGALPKRENNIEGDADAFFIQEVLGLKGEAELVTPILLTRDFKIRYFSEDYSGALDQIVQGYSKLSANKDLMLVAGSGSFLFSAKILGADGPAIARALGTKVLLCDRYNNELNYDYLLCVKEAMGDQFIGVIINDVPDHYMDEAKSIIKPCLARKGIDVLGIVPKDPLMSAITISRLNERLGGKLITADHKDDKLVESFLIGTMHVENFLTHFRRRKNSAVIVGGDRSDLQLVAMEGHCSCLILTGNLYPNDIIMTRAEVLGVPILVVHEDTYTVAKKMEHILGSQKLRDMIKVNHGERLINSEIDFQLLKGKLGLK